MSFAQAREVKMRDRRLMDGELLSIRPVRLYVLLANRNAWHSTTSRRYNGAGGLFGSLDAAQRAAEDLRKPGTWFKIMDAPGLALRGEGGLVVTAEHHSNTSFGAWDVEAGRQHLVIGTRLWDVVRALGTSGTWRRQTSEHSFITGILGDLFVEDLRGDWFQEWDSESRGSSYYLSWTEYRGDYKRDGVDAVRDAFIEVNGVDAVEEGERRYFAARDAEYTDTLGTGFRVPRPDWFPDDRVA
ncbi:hypothetical protein AB3X52_00365 [Nocardioides sp. DS6]|uniref:Uncharacterized protein n=1 Tax=Nocardioides eburneus TaxID=3231482 RepID=A0ABV3SSY5_9ACTN